MSTDTDSPREKRGTRQRLYSAGETGMRRYVLAAVVAVLVAWAWLDARDRHRPQVLPIMATPSGPTRVLWLPGELEQ